MALTGGGRETIFPAVSSAISRILLIFTQFVALGLLVFPENVPSFLI
jgi:hypothetical protein